MLTAVAEDLHARVRDLVAAWNRFDAEGYVALCDPEIEFFSFLAKVEGNAYTGHDGVRQYFRDIETLDRRSLDVQSVAVVGNRVAVRLHVCGEGHRSGIRLDAVISNLLTFREGKLLRLEAFVSPDEALRELGLERWRDGTTSA
jgi:ketosteroid isomerase-like protein